MKLYVDTADRSAAESLLATGYDYIDQSHDFAARVQGRCRPQGDL